MKNKRGFTLVEILVVATIVSLLASGGFVVYTQFSRQSRDARRKADIEQIRGAMEIYRSNVGTYPDLTFTCPSGGLTDASGNTYLSRIPNDPKCPGQNYSLSGVSATDYTLCTTLEASPGNYCVGPYGQR